MPEYEYLCTGPCQSNFSIFYKSLPSEKKQKEANCPDCDTVGKRLISPFLAGNSSSSGIEKAMGNNADSTNIGGRMLPTYVDANGVRHEVKSVRDMDAWQRSNQYGPPRIVKWRNPITGETSMVPQRVKMIADPVSGEPMDAPVVRESVPLVPIDHFEMPSETKSGIPLDPKTGTPKVKDISKARIPGTKGLIDPETNKPFTMGGVWGDTVGGNGNRAAAQDTLKGKQMSQGDVVRILSGE